MRLSSAWLYIRPVSYTHLDVYKRQEIGWYPETMFKDGISLTIQWFFEHEDWMKNVTSGDYQKYYEEMYKNK